MTAIDLLEHNTEQFALAPSDSPEFSNAPAHQTLRYLLKLAGYGVSPEAVIEDARLRHDLLEKTFLNWITSETVAEGSVFGLILVAAQTIEASNENCDPGILQTSIGRFMSRSNVQPTHMHVTPKVTDLLPDTLAAEYLDRMLARTGGAENGWLPINDEERIQRFEWAQRFIGYPVFDTIVHQFGLDSPAA